MAADAQGFSKAGDGSQRDHGLVALVVGFLLLVAAVFATILLTVRQQQAYAMVSHTLEVENQIALVLSRLQDAETGERGFLLTGRPEFLQPYENAAANVPLDLARLRLLVADNPRQIAAVNRLAAVAGIREDLLRTAVAKFRVGESLPPEHFLRGRALMEQIRAIVERMKQEEGRLLAARTEGADRNATYIAAMLVISAMLVIALGLFAFVNSRRRLADAIRAGLALVEANRNMLREAEAREAAENQLRQMQKVEAVGQLTGGIAHDFNNMLAVVIGSLDLAAKRLEAGETVRAARNVDNAMDGARRAAQLTARLLAFSRQQALSPQPVDINKLVGGMSDLLLRTIGEQLRVETVLAGGLWRTFADPGQLENAIVNLCVNARDAMPEGGKLTIETSNAHLDDDYAAAHAGIDAGQYVMVSLTDTGSGMSPEVVERAFDPFFTTKAPGQGTGLGLSQVYGFVKQSRGHLKIYSEVGTGTTVKIYLPRFTGSALDRTMEPEAGDEALLPHARGETVLVVEDDERVRHVSVESLRSLGYTVVQAADAAQAMAVLTLQPAIQLLFTDVVMPDKNGRQLAEEALAARPQLKVLYTTGYTRNAIVHNGMLDADVAFLAKPFTIEQLARKVRRVLDEGAA
jgi:signal transduction histidine kinase/ActR/RegA family two-component response regulator